MIKFEDFKEIDIRVAEILDVRDHPDADRLYVLTIHNGETEKQIVAGIRSVYSRDELVGRKIIVIDNLEPAVIRGETSDGMLLAAGSDNGPVLLTPEKEVPAGSKVR